MSLIICTPYRGRSIVAVMGKSDEAQTCRSLAQKIVLQPLLTRHKATHGSVCLFGTGKRPSFNLRGEAKAFQLPGYETNPALAEGKCE